MGSDHDVYQESGFHIPAIYLNDWPDRYIHTNFDSAANIDPTKLKRAAFIGAASGYFLSVSTLRNSPDFPNFMVLYESQSILDAMRRSNGLDEDETVNMLRGHYDYMQRIVESVNAWAGNESPILPGAQPLGAQVQNLPPEKPASGDGLLVFTRNAQPKGPLAVFGYDYFEDHAKAARVSTPKLLDYHGPWGAREDYEYETLTLVDGERNATQLAT